MQPLSKVFGVNKPVIGMLHVPALPGSPRCRSSFSEIEDHVLRDAQTLAQAGLHGLLLENFGDRPFFKDSVPPHVIALMTALAVKIRERFPLPLGINVLRNDAMAALAIATATQASFIRVNVWQGARLTDQGLIEGQAAEVLRYRTLLNSRVLVFADVAVKHSWPLAETTLSEEIENATERALADAIVISGSKTGTMPDLSELQQAYQLTRRHEVPLLVGSGVNAGNLESLFKYADGFIVGTALKEDGIVDKPVDFKRAQQLIDTWRRLSEKHE